MSPRLFDAYFQIMRQCDPNFDLKVNISQCDLYFMVFCLLLLLFAYDINSFSLDEAHIITPVDL